MIWNLKPLVGAIFHAGQHLPPLRRFVNQLELYGPGILIFMQRITAGLKRIRSFCDCAARAINLKANMKVIFLDIDGVPKAA